MKPLDRLALLTYVIDCLGERDWPGRTRIQKIVYFGQELFGFPSSYEFEIYQYGPYSAELDSDIQLLTALGWVATQPHEPLYGPTYHVTESGASVAEKLYPSLAEVKPRIDKAVKLLGRFKAQRLELLATIHYIQATEPEANREKIISIVHALKPYFDDPNSISKAIDDLEKICQVANS